VPDIEFSFEVKERTLDICLHDEGTVAAITISLSLFQNGLNLVKSKAHLYAITTVTVFSRLHYPSVVFLMFSFLLTAFGYFLCPLMIVPQKLEILLIFKSIFNVKSEGKIIEYILFHLLVIVAHCVKESLLITKDIVIDKMVMHAAFLQLASLYVLPVFQMFCP
jgi:hypothetical protein